MLIPFRPVQSSLKKRIEIIFAVNPRKKRETKKERVFCPQKGTGIREHFQCPYFVPAFCGGWQWKNAEGYGKIRPASRYRLRVLWKSMEALELKNGAGGRNRTDMGARPAGF